MVGFFSGEKCTNYDMESFWQMTLMAGGLVLLYFGAESLVKGGSAIGLRLGLTPLVVGLTIVAYGTSTPELFVGISAALENKGDLVIGNVVGANILNIALMLGVAAMIHPQQVRLQLLRNDLPVMLAAYIMLIIFMIDGGVGRVEGILFFGGFIGYTAYHIVHARMETNRVVEKEYEADFPEPMSWMKAGGLVLLGLGLLAGGSQLLVENATAFARNLGVSEAIIGLTIVAIGTTSPELATAVVAARKGKSDIVFGNSLGSCLYNTLCVVGLAAFIVPLEAPGVSLVDMGMMLFLGVLLFPLMRTGWRLSRWEGGLLLWIYVGYLIYLWPKQ